MKKYWHEYMRTWNSNAITQSSTLLVLTATFTVIFSFFSVLLNLNSVLSKWGKDIQVSVFLKEDVSEQEISDIREAISKLGFTNDVGFVSKDEARTKFLKQMPGFAKDVINDPEFTNPFPASLQIGGLKKEHLDKLEEYAQSLAEVAGVEDVSYGQEWISNYSHLVSGLASGGWLVVVTLLFGSLFVISNSIRVSLAQRREEIEILELVGASQAQVRGPYLFEGAMNGVLASVLAVFASYGVHLAQLKLLGKEMGFLGLDEVFSYFNFYQIVLLIGFGVISGMLGSWLCVRAVNTGWSASQKGVSSNT